MGCSASKKQPAVAADVPAPSDALAWARRLLVLAAVVRRSPHVLPLASLDAAVRHVLPLATRSVDERRMVAVLQVLGLLPAAVRAQQVVLI